MNMANYDAFMVISSCYGGRSIFLGFTGIFLILGFLNGVLYEWSIYESFLKVGIIYLHLEFSLTIFFIYNYRKIKTHISYRHSLCNEKNFR